MKAKVKATGEVIDVKLNMNVQPIAETGASHVYVDSSGSNYLDTDLDFNITPPDWEQIRVQASIAAMQGLLNATSPERYTLKIKEEVIAKDAVAYADALIVELKKIIEEEKNEG